MFLVHLNVHKFTSLLPFPYSGSTAEFLGMWVLMMIGPVPFFINPDSGSLEMQLTPILPAWLFQHNPSAITEEQYYFVNFKLFTSIDVTYYTSQAQDIFGVAPERYQIGLRDGSKVRFDRPTIPTDYALKIRRVVFIDYIHAYF